MAEDYDREPDRGKVRTVLHEFKVGKLRSSSGQKVKSRKQAIAIALSEGRRKGRTRRRTSRGRTRMRPPLKRRKRRNLA